MPQFLADETQFQTGGAREALTQQPAIPQFLQVRGTSPDSLRLQMGPLAAHLAAFEGMEKAVLRISVDAPSMLSARNLDGETPAHHAAAAGKHGIIDILGRIDPKLVMMKDNDGQTPAHTASMYRQVEVLRALSRRAPDSFEVRDNCGLSPLDLAADNAECRGVILPFLKVAWPPSSAMPGTRRHSMPAKHSQSMRTIHTNPLIPPPPARSLERTLSTPIPPPTPPPSVANALSAASTPLMDGNVPTPAPHASSKARAPITSLTPTRLFASLSPFAALPLRSHQPPGSAEAVATAPGRFARLVTLLGVVLLCGCIGTATFCAVVELVPPPQPQTPNPKP